MKNAYAKQYKKLGGLGPNVDGSEWLLRKDKL